MRIIKELVEIWPNEVCDSFTFTIAGSHIGWALMKNGERAIDRMN